jgi:hypothetical protein
LLSGLAWFTILLWRHGGAEKGGTLPYGTASPSTENLLKAHGLAGALGGFGALKRTIEIDVIFDGALDETFRVHADKAHEVFELIVMDLNANFPISDWTISLYDRTNEDNPERLREVNNRGAS